MSETPASWGEVGNKVSDLGTKLRAHFEQSRSSSAAGEPGSAESAGSAGSASEAGAEGDRLHETLRKLGDALDGVVDALGAVVKDPAVKDDVKQVGTALTGALAASFAEISDDLRHAFRRGAPRETPTPTDGPGGEHPEPPPTGTEP